VLATGLIGDDVIPSSLAVHPADHQIAILVCRPT
jgi:hypothetical protein